MLRFRDEWNQSSRRGSLECQVWCSSPKWMSHLFHAPSSSMAPFPVMFCTREPSLSLLSGWESSTSLGFGQLKYGPSTTLALGMSNGYNCRRGSKRVFGFSPSFASLNIWLALLSLLPAQRWIWFPSLLSSSARPPSLFISGRQGRGFVQSMCTLFSCVPMEIVEAATTSRR